MPLDPRLRQVVKALQTPLKQVVERPELQAAQKTVANVVTDVQSLSSATPRKQYQAAKKQLARLREIRQDLLNTGVERAPRPGDPPSLLEVLPCIELDIAIGLLQQFCEAFVDATIDS